MLESKTDYYRVISEAFGSVVPGTREARKEVYDAARKSVREQAKLAPHRFDGAAELRALEKAILDIEISAKLGEPIPRMTPGAEPKPASSTASLPPRPAFLQENPANQLPRPFVADPFNYRPAGPAPQNVEAAPPAGPRVEWTDAGPQPPRAQPSSPQSPQPYQPPRPLPSTFDPPRTVVRHVTPQFQPGFLNRTDRISYARRADPPPPPRPQPQPARQAPPPPPMPSAAQMQAPALASVTAKPSSISPVQPGPAEIPDDLKAALPPRSALAGDSDVNILDESQSVRAKKVFIPKDAPHQEKRRGGFLRIMLIVMLAASVGGAIAYYGKQDQILAQLKEFLKSDPSSQTKKPSTGATVSLGEQREPTAQEMVEVAIQQIAGREYRRALGSLDEARARGARGADFYQARAFANWGLGEAELAIADYGEAIRLDPGNASNFTNRAVAYNARGEYQLAVRDLERAIAIEPGNPDNWNSRCWSRALAGMVQEAILDCNESLRLRPNDPNTLDSRGFAHLKAGQNSRAIADFEAALKIDPKIPSSLYGRGIARMRSGDRINSYTDIAEAKAIKPDIDALFAKYGIR